MIIPGLEFLNRESLRRCGDGSDHANRPADDDARNGPTSARGSSLMDAGHSKAMLQFIIRPRQALNIIAVEQPYREIVSDLTKMLKGTGKWPQCGDLVSCLGKESQILFTDVLACLLLWIGENRFRLMHEPVGVLKWWPQRRSGL